MSPGLAKEFRALRLPWLVGLAAALAWPLSLAAGPACAALLAAMSFGNEFHHHTLALLLTQPRPRRQVWREKLLVLGALVGSIALVLVVELAAPLDYPPARAAGTDLAVIAAFFIATVCSAPLWTLVARSMIGGLVFSLAGAALALLLSAQWALHWHLGWRISNVIPGYSANPDSTIGVACLFAGLVYSGACLYAARWKFERLELNDPIVGESTILSGGPAARRGRAWRWLRIRPKGALGNLVRKELRLQRPTLVVAGAFCVCWLAVALKPSTPGDIYELVLRGLPCGYIVLALALAGSLSRGEERALGLAAWHLTLPISVRRQWWVKLAVAAAVALILGLVLPGLLALATLPEARAELDSMHLHDLLLKGLPIGAGRWLFFVLTFWAATLLRDTVGAFFMAGLSSAALGLCVALSVPFAEQAGGLETGLLREISSRIQRPLPYADDMVYYAFALGALVVSFVALAQSRYQFRRVQVPRESIITGVALLLAIATLAGAWWADFRLSLQNDVTLPLRTEVLQAVRALPYPERQLLDSPRGISLTESDLERVYPLSAQTKRWLRGAKLSRHSVTITVDQQAFQTDRAVVSIEFPNGCSLTIDEGEKEDPVVPDHADK